MASSLLALRIRMLFAFLFLSSSIASSTVPRFLKRQLGAAAIATSLATPLAAYSVPLGVHSGCAYPACTTQIEVWYSRLSIRLCH